MAPAAGLFIAGLNFTQAESFSAGLYRFAADRSLALSGAEVLSQALALPSWEEWSSKTLEWFSRPDVFAIITAWWITFTVVATIIMFLGFGPGGIVAGSVAAVFQSLVYGAFTPAGGIFATLTSMGMMGKVFFPLVLGSSIIATCVAALVWGIGVGQ